MYNLIKRILDIFFSGLAILIIIPFLIPIILCLIFTGEGEVFYFQKRVGYKNKNFNIYKFATMLKNSTNLPGGIITTTNDPRITPMGGFLRKSKINELPQLLNIFLGHMSIVGPRPVMKQSFETYPNDVQKIIYNVKPGLTGIGSIIFRDEEFLISEVKNNGGDTWAFYKEKIYPFKGEVEKWYQRNRSFIIDFKIILITAYVIILPKNNNIIYEVFKDLPIRKF